MGSTCLRLLPVALALLACGVEGFAFTATGVGSGLRCSRPQLRSTSRVRASNHAGSSARSLEMRLDIGPGSYVALVTPMSTSGAVDEDSLRGLLRWHLEAGTDGIVALGTTGEASTLSMAERRTVLDITREEVGGKLPIVVGTGGINPHHVVEYGQQAIECGADGVLVVTPYYVKPTQNGLVQFYNFVADGVDLPLIMYNVPGRTGVDMEAGTVAECSKHPRIVGIKEATGDNTRVAPLLEQCEKGFMLYSGDDLGGKDFCLEGGVGVISVTANVAPKEMSEMLAKIRAGDKEAAQAIDGKLDGLHTHLFSESNPIPTKWALNRMGKASTGHLRLPLTELEESNHAVVEQALRQAGCV